MNRIVLAGIVLVIVIILVFTFKENLSMTQWMDFYDCNLTYRRPPIPLPPCGSADTYGKKSRCGCCSIPGPGCQSGKCDKTLFKGNECFSREPEEYTGNVILPKFDKLQLKEVGTIDTYSLDQILDFVDAGNLVVSATNENIIGKLLKYIKFVGGNGYPDFYDVEGPVLILNKVENEYYYMIDYPVKYRPATITNYANKTQYENVARKSYTLGARLLQGCSPVYIFETNAKTENSTNLFDVTIPCPKSPWGTPYGCGNWLLEV